MRLIPFIHQTRTSPVIELCHTKSGLPSPLKSPAPTIFQFVSGSWLGLKYGAEINDVPSMNHTAISPVPSRCHTRSGLPSPLKSPVVTIFHVVSVTALGLKNGAEINDVVVLAVAVAWWAQHRNEPIPIAVLPLENTGHDPADEYLADGLTEELIRNLSIIDGLAVRSRTSSFDMKGKQRNIREAGRQLQADYILEGAVLRAGQRLRIDVQLVRVHDDFPLWSGRFDRELSDVFAIQDEISVGIVNNLRLKLGRGRRRYDTSVEAYDLYLRARAKPNQRSRES